MLAGGQLTVIDTSSVSLRLPPSPTGEGLSSPSAEFHTNFILQHSVKVVKGRNVQFCFKKNNAYRQPSPVGEGGAVYRDG